MKRILLLLFSFLVFQTGLNSQVLYKDKKKIKSMEFNAMAVLPPESSKMDERHLNISMYFYEAIEEVLQKNDYETAKYVQQGMPKQYYDTISSQEICQQYEADAILYTGANSFERDHYYDGYLYDKTSHLNIGMTVTDCDGMIVLRVMQSGGTKLKLEPGKTNNDALILTTQCLTKVLEKLKLIKYREDNY